MKTPTTLIIDGSFVRKHIGLRQAIRYVERAFRDEACHRAQMPPKIYLDLKRYNGDFRAMPAYLEQFDACTLKWVNVHPNNARKGLPTVMGTIIYSDPKTGFPLAVMDGTYATSLRTAAAGGVAAKYCARKDSQSVALVGCGAQARSQLLALRTIFKIKDVHVWGHKNGLAKRYIDDMKIKGERMTAVASVKECVRGCDIVVTTTPSRKPLVKKKWLKPGVHINAIGADAPGKQELDPAILKSARIIIDLWEQAAHSGEINVPLRKKIISKRNIHAKLGEVVTGRKKGRHRKNEITVFDSTGLAIQDVAVASLIYRTALRTKKGRKVKLMAYA